MSRGGEARVNHDLLEKYDRPGPRYTSYPTAVEFSNRFSEASYRDRLAEADRLAGEQLSLYVHLPFCEERCSFCGCNVVITKHREASVEYLAALHEEIDLLARHLKARRRVSQYHWGGGTPTYQTVEQMRALHAKVVEHFEIDSQAETAIEVDPRVTSQGQLEALIEMGFRRISMGVQDFSPEVQAAIGRNQTEAQTRELYEHARRCGFASINLDMIYGLPLQTAASFERNLDATLDLRPDRLAVYSYAHVPWVKASQKRLDPAQLPPPDVKLELFVIARKRLLSAGYVQIGMDHFALPDDELALAAARGRLHRNFMGYTVKMGTDMVGVGVSAIGDVRGSFAQNVKHLPAYYQALQDGRFPIERGYRLDRDDVIRREVITRLMCNFQLDRREIERTYGIDFRAYFALELEELARAGGPVADGFLVIGPDRLDVVGDGRLFIRNICMTFDRYLRDRPADAPSFSRTV